MNGTFQINKKIVQMSMKQTHLNYLLFELLTWYRTCSIVQTNNRSMNNSSMNNSLMNNSSMNNNSMNNNSMNNLVQ